MKNYSILDDANTNVLAADKLREMFQTLGTLNENSNEYKNLLDEIGIHNVRLIPTFGKQYLNKIEVDDLIALGYPGLEKAIKGYDVDSNVPFPSYAKWWIQTELKRNAYMEYTPYTLSKRENDLLCKFYMYCAKFEEENGKEPEFEDIISLLDVTDKQVDFLRRTVGLTVSSMLDSTIDEEGEVTMLDRVASYDANPYSGTTIIKNLLTDDEYSILLARSEGYSIPQIASEFHMEVNEAKKVIKDIINKVSTNDVLEALRDSNRY